MREGLPKGVVPRLHLDVFPPTTTKICINLWLEVITPTGEGGNELKNWHLREPRTQQGQAQLRIKLSPQQRYLLERVAFLLGLWTLLVQFANTREANTGLEQRNKSKLLTLLGQPSCLTVSHGKLKNRVFPWVFVHREPIRRRHLRSHDSHVGFLQSAVRAS